MEKKTIRILVVDDYAPWRRFVLSALQTQPELQIISETSDGLEAVQKAEELQPDLILLDIGLPRLSGIEACRRIRELSPQSRILVISEHRSLDIANAALARGALGYVVKSDAGSELMPAIEAVLQGKRYVGTSLAGHVLPDILSGDLIHHSGAERASLRLVPDHIQPERYHELGLYANDAALIKDFASFAKYSLEAGRASIVVATDAHRTGILQSLRSDAVDVDTAIRQGRYIELDPHEMLSQFMINDMPDAAQFMTAATDLIARAADAAHAEQPRVAACGESAPTLLAQGKVEAAIRLEQLWDDVARKSKVDILCGYLSSGFPRRERGSIADRICLEHSAFHTA